PQRRRGSRASRGSDGRGDAERRSSFPGARPGPARPARAIPPRRPGRAPPGSLRLLMPRKDRAIDDRTNDHRGAQPRPSSLARTKLPAESAEEGQYYLDLVPDELGLAR